jgi:hypothetical protein
MNGKERTLYFFFPSDREEGYFWKEAPFNLTLLHKKLFYDFL